MSSFSSYTNQKVPSLIAQEWITRAIALNDGESISILVPDRREQTVLRRDLLQIKEQLRFVYAEEMAKLVISSTIKNRKFFVQIEKGIPTQLEGFLQDQNGVREVIEIKKDLGRTRRIRLMVEDRLSLKEIEELEGKLSEEELLFFFPAEFEVEDN
jgi:hypothetical protein